MKNKIIVSCFFSAVFSFAAVQMVQAATKKGWTAGGADRYWDTSGNFKNISATKDGYYLRSGEGSALDATKRTILFNKVNEESVRVTIESAGTSDDIPYVFLADTDDYGLTLKADFEVGNYKVGHLHVKRGIYQGYALKVGNGSNSGNVPLVIGGDENKAKMKLTYSSAAVLLNKGTTKVLANGTLESTGRFKVGTTSGQTGELLVDGGTVNVSGDYFSVGATSGGTGKVIINSGNVSHTGSGDIPIGDHGSGSVTVKAGGKLGNSASSTGIRVGNNSAATLDVQGGEVELTKGALQFSSAAGDGSVTITEGGKITIPKITCSTGNGTGTITINGGTIRATQDSVEFIPANEKLNVYVGAAGATFDTDGYAITIGENLQNKSGEAGTVTFKGGGVITLLVAGNYTGLTTVEVGTTLIVPTPSSIGAGLVVAVPDKTPANGTYKILSCSGEGVFADAVLDGVAVPAGATLGLSQDKKFVFCTYGDGDPVWIGGTAGSLSDSSKWANGVVPGVGTNCIISVGSAATLTLGDAFAASSITFSADSAAVTINAADSESMVGITAITNLSQTVSHTINVPVYFTGDIQVSQMADYYEHLDLSHIVFAGGAYAGEGSSIENGTAVNYSHCMFGKYCFANASNNRWTAPKYSNCRLAVADDSTLFVPYANNLTELYLGSNAKVFVGDLALNGRLMYCMGVGSEMVVTNMTLSGSGDKYITYGQGTSNPGVFKFKGITNSMSDNWFYFSDANTAGKHTIYIGEEGLNFANDSGSAGYSIGRDSEGNSETIRPWNSNFTIGARSSDTYGLVFQRDVTICTDDEGGTGRVITIDAKTRAYSSTVITISGTGTLQVNNGCYNSAKPSVVVTDTATLAFAAGATLGAGPLSLGADTTLVVASANLPIDVASLALPESGKVTIRITGDASLLDGVYELFATSTSLPAGFAEKINLILPDGTSATRCLYTTDGGTLKLFIGEGELPDPYTWTGAANDGKLSTPGNWRGSEVPAAGSAVFFPMASGEIVNDIEGFAPASITFGYGSDVKVSGNTITGVQAITNLFSSVIEIACRVDFAETFRLHGANQSVNFSGGAYATYPDASITSDTLASHTLMGEIHFSEDWTIPNQPSGKPFVVAPNARVYGKTVAASSYQNSNYHLRIDEGAIATFETVAVAGKLVFHLNGGNLVSTGDITLGGNGDGRDFGYYNAKNTGTVEAHGIYKSVTGHGKIYQYITEMIVGAGGYGMYRKDYQIQFMCDLRLTAKETLVIHKPIAEDGPKNGDWGLFLNGKTFTINTAGHTVTFDSYVGNGEKETSGAIVKEGEGELIMASLEKRYSGGTTVNAGRLTVQQQTNGLGSGAVTVNSSATLALMNGVNTGAGAVTVNNGATLEVAESGAVTLGGNITLEEGAVLGFNFTDRKIVPVLEIADGKTVTFGANKAIKVFASGIKRPVAGKHILTSGGDFSESIVTLADGSPNWVKGVSVEDGAIVLDVKAIGTVLTVR